MKSRDEEITVHVRYGGIEKTFSGNLEEVWFSLFRFFSEFIPSFETAKRLMLNVDLQALAKQCEGIFAFSNEGASLLVPKEKLTDNETLLLWLLAQHVGFQLGLLRSESLSRNELKFRLGKNAKITSTRIGELVKGRLACKTADEKYKITSFGLAQMQKEIISRVIARIGSV